MQFEGTLTHWQDDRGFGYVQNHAGGEHVFVHIKAFTRVPRRLELNQRVRFDVHTCAKGKKWAVNVQLARPHRRARRRRFMAPAGWALSALGGSSGLALWLTPLGDKLGQWLGA